MLKKLNLVNLKVISMYTYPFKRLAHPPKFYASYHSLWRTDNQQAGIGNEFVY